MSESLDLLRQAADKAAAAHLELAAKTAATRDSLPYLPKVDQAHYMIYNPDGQLVCSPRCWCKNDAATPDNPA